jgi:hypothetical protein
MSIPKITPKYIPETEVPCRNIEHSFWRTTFLEIPEGQALVLEKEYARKAYEAMRKFKSRAKKDWVKFEAVKRRDKTYVVHYCEKECQK